MNLFDNIQKAAFGIVTETFGYDASWQPSDASDYQRASVLLKEPTKASELGNIEYSPTTYIAEYHSPNLEGLKAAVDNGNTEILTINGIEYFVRQVNAAYDGKTFRAILEKMS